MRAEIAERSVRLERRIKHFAAQFGLAPEDFWEALEANPGGPLAAVLTKEARRQNIYETAVARYIEALPNVSAFCKLASHGSKACYVNSDGQILTGTQLAQASKPSKSLDFQWITGTFSCYAAQKYTKEGGGTQDSQYNEMEKLLRNYQGRTNNGMAFFVLVDGPYYTETKIRQLRSLTRQLRPRSYVTRLNGLHAILVSLASA